MYKTMVLGTNDKTNPHNRPFYFNNIILNIQTRNTDLASKFQASIVVPSENIKETGTQK